MKIFCQKCGSELKDGVVICPKCGFENKIAKTNKRKKLILGIAIMLLVVTSTFIIFFYRNGIIDLPHSINKTVARFIGVKEYSGKDLVENSLEQRSEGAQNWKAEITDERDGNTYKIVKMPDDRWWMAQNLNYQQGLVQNERSDFANGEEFSTTENGIQGIGSYWCNDGFYLPWSLHYLDDLDKIPLIFRPQGSPPPRDQIISRYPGEKGSGNAVERTNTCNTYGALYTWETAMMPDGKGDWVETNYSYSDNDHGRDICPFGWHVPTDIEWSNMLNSIEDDLETTKNHDSIIYNWAGNYAGTLLKSSGICRDCKPSSTEPLWQTYQYENEESYIGIDFYGFRVIPAGNRGDQSFRYAGKGTHAYFWSSTRDSSTNALFRKFDSYESRVFRGFYNRMSGFSVRCVQDN